MNIKERPRYAILNGHLIYEKDAKVSVIDKAFFFDFAVYSSLKVIQKKVFFADYHVERLFESAAIIGINHQFQKEDVLRWINNLINENKLEEGLIKMVLIGDAQENKIARLYIVSVTGVTFFPKKFYNNGIKVITYKGQRRFPRAKTKDLLMSFLASKEAREKGATDALLIDSDGCIRESTRANFFAIKDGVLYMPPEDKDLGGITKKFILKAAQEDGIRAVEKDIKLEEINTYDEIFLSSTLFNAMPIGEIDGVEFESDFVITKRLGKLYKTTYDKEVFGKE